MINHCDFGLSRRGAPMVLQEIYQHEDLASQEVVGWIWGGISNRVFRCRWKTVLLIPVFYSRNTAKSCVKSCSINNIILRSLWKGCQLFFTDFCFYTLKTAISRRKCLCLCHSDNIPWLFLQIKLLLGTGWFLSFLINWKPSSGWTYFKKNFFKKKPSCSVKFFLIIQKAHDK